MSHGRIPRPHHPPFGQVFGQGQVKPVFHSMDVDEISRMQQERFDPAIPIARLHSTLDTANRDFCPMRSGLAPWARFFGTKDEPFLFIFESNKAHQTSS